MVTFVTLHVTWCTLASYMKPILLLSKERREAMGLPRRYAKLQRQYSATFMLILSQFVNTEHVPVTWDT